MNRLYGSHFKWATTNIYRHEFTGETVVGGAIRKSFQGVAVPLENLVACPYLKDQWPPTVGRPNAARFQFDSILMGVTTMSNANSTALPAPLSNLSQYLQLVETFPRLNDNEERALSERLKQDNDLDAARKLILSHLRYVVYIARGYTGYGLPQEDLIQEGNVGLMKAVRRFDPARGVRLVAYACYWIRAHIHEFILKNWRIVKVTTTKSRRKLFYKLRGAKQRLDWLHRDEAEDIARSLGVDAADVIEMEAQMYVSDQPFDVPSEELPDDTRSLSDYLEDTGSSPDHRVAQDQFLGCASIALRDALQTLDIRSRDIIESRWLAEDADKPTLQSLGERYGVSAERIRQLEVAAISRLREMMVRRLGVDCCEVELPRQRSLIAV